nr:peptidylprolyl isomerase [Haloferula luteola]
MLAHVATTLGDITVDLQYAAAPKTVANFITLAQGTRAHLDPTSGTLSHTPYYVGESFFRVVNDTTFKIAQTGSGTGTNSGGPGFTFPDEFAPSLRHGPYMLSMANSGPNSNGSQIFFVGNSTPSHLDDVHTIFGLIPDSASRAVIDAIHAAGSNGSSITAITFERTDAAAEAFDEFAQGLPEVTPATATLAVTPGENVDLLPSPPLQPGEFLSIQRSTDLAVWADHLSLYAGPEDLPVETVQTESPSPPSQAFYRITRVTYPEALAPGSLANRTLVVLLPDTSDSVTLTFDATGTGGTCDYTGSNTSGTLTYVDYAPSAYGMSLVFSSTNVIPLNILGSFDSETDGTLIGRHSLYGWSNSAWTSLGSSTLTLSH